MAYSKSRSYGRTRSYGRSRSYGRRRRSKYSAIERHAYMHGLLKRGLSNPDSRISASYNAGKNTVNRKKKSLF